MTPETNARGKVARWFFVGMALLLAMIVAVGFSPSFYLRHVASTPHTVSPDLPMYLIVHGVVLTSWYLLFAAQTWLIATKQSRFHRSLGILGAFLAVLVFSVSMTVVLRAPARNIAAGASVEEISLMVVGDIAILVLFAVLVTLSIRFRMRKDVHKRLMALASVSIVAPAIARWPGAKAFLPLSVVLPQLSFCAALIVYDIVTRRRVHPATCWGVASYLFVVGVSVPLAFSNLGHQVVNALK